MPDALPFLTRYDPPGQEEGALDPLGLYLIADQLASTLVPAIRERMQRIRFLTAIAVGAVITGGMQANPEHRDADPYLIWEWYVVEAFIRSGFEEVRSVGVPGSQVVATTLAANAPVGAASYLKNPRAFGFHGVYKRLAVHLGIVDEHLAPGPNAEGLIDAWARDAASIGAEEAKQRMQGWAAAIKRSLNADLPTTTPNWRKRDWDDLSSRLSPEGAGRRERRFLRGLLLATGERGLGALPALRELLDETGATDPSEEHLHNELKRRLPDRRALMDAIQAYERFARALQDGFDRLRLAAGERDARGLHLDQLAADRVFARCLTDLEKRYATAATKLGAVDIPGRSLQTEFAERFARFGEPINAGDLARVLCDHHEAVQRGKSFVGKRCWFDRLDANRIYLRQGYRLGAFVPQPNRYVHPFRAIPIRRFRQDLT